MSLKRKISAGILLAGGLVGTTYFGTTSVINYFKCGQSSGDIRTAQYINETSPTEASVACVPCLYELRDINFNNLNNSLGLLCLSLGTGLSGAAGLFLRNKKSILNYGNSNNQSSENFPYEPSLKKIDPSLEQIFDDSQSLVEDPSEERSQVIKNLL